MRYTAEENKRWDGLVEEMQNYTLMWNFNRYFESVPRGTVTQDAGEVRKPDMMNLRVWLNTVRAQTPDSLIGIGQVLHYYRSDAQMPISVIHKYGFAADFGFGGRSVPVPAPVYSMPSYIEKPAPRTKSSSRVSFFRDLHCKVDPTIEDATVIKEIEKVSGSLLLRAVKSPQVSVMEWLDAYSDGCYLVLLAMIREGVASPLTAVRTKATTIIQYCYPEETIAASVVDSLFNSLTLPRLALFLRNPEEDDLHWPSLFSGIKPSVLRKILVKYGKKEIEVNGWDAGKLVDTVKTFSPTQGHGHKTDYKIEILKLFRENGSAQDTFPWFSTEELTKWLNPVDPMELEEEEVICFAPKTPKPKLSKLGQLLETNEMTNPGTTAFVQAYEEAGYEYEDIETMLTELNNPNTASLLKLLTDPQRMKLLRVWRAAK